MLIVTPSFDLCNVVWYVCFFVVMAQSCKFIIGPGFCPFPCVWVGIPYGVFFPSPPPPPRKRGGGGGVEG